MRSFFAASLIVFLLAANTLSAATFIEQKYRLLGLTSSRDQDVFWILEDLTGEGESSHLLQVVLKPTTSPLLIITWLRQFGDWQWLVEGMGKVETEHYLSLVNEQGLFVDSSGKIQITAPPPDAAAMEAFKAYDDSTSGGGAVSWNTRQGAAGVRAPIVDGVRSQAVYFCPGGLYIDYSITDVFYFPRAEYLLLFTHQDMLATGMDTMHGFIVLKIEARGE